MILNHYSLGIGDRFGRQGKAQPRALIKARELGVAITPVWNKSNREHLIIHTSPMDVRREADAAVRVLAWEGAYHVDADHIGLNTVELFLDPCGVTRNSARRTPRSSTSIGAGFPIRTRFSGGTARITRGLCDTNPIARNVTENIFERHIKRIFLGD